MSSSVAFPLTGEAVPTAVHVPSNRRSTVTLVAYELDTSTVMRTQPDDTRVTPTDRGAAGVVWMPAVLSTWVDSPAGFDAHMPNW